MSSYALGTPQKAFPGAYIQTPAVNKFQTRQPNPRPNPALSQQQNALQYQGQDVQAGGQKPGVEDLQPIARGAKAVNEALTEESRYPDLDSYIGQGISSEYEANTQSAWAPFQKVKMHTIPDRIFEQYNRAQVSTIMGLFADFNHAWVAIDNALYLWDYTHPNPDLVSFEEQPHTITAVRLAVPRPGVFMPSVVRILVVATTAEMILIGMSTQPAPHGGSSVALYSLKMSMPIKGLDVTVIEGSASTGRVFFSGNSSDDVYEFAYQQEERWFQNRCTKVNHTSKGYSTLTPSTFWGSKARREIVVQMVVDDTRKLLYTLSNRSTIRTFYIKDNGGLDLVITKPLGQTLSNVGHMTSQSELISPSMKLVSISAITANEATKTHLMTTTSTGCRIFMSATSSYGYYSSSSSAPTSMQVQHVKFPPAENSSSQPYQASTSTQMTTYSNNPTINTSSRALNPTRTAVRYAPGYFLAFVAREPQAGTDLLFLSGPDTARIAQPQDQARLTKYTELALWLNLGSRAEDIGLATGPFSAGPSPVGFGNELAVQFDKPTSQIAVLTNTGVHMLRRRRLVDIFAAALRLGGGDEGLEGEVKKFIRQYGRDETASTALAVACGQASDVTSDSRLARIQDPDILEHARKAFIEYGGKPLFNENSMLDQSVPAIDLVRPSPRHKGLSLYISRLVRSIWKAPIMIEGVTPSGGLAILSSVSMNKLQDISLDLTKLKEFLSVNKSFIEGLAGPEALGNVNTKQEEISLQAEHRALHALVVLIDNIIEGIAFVLVLYDEKIEEIVLSLANETRQQVRDLSYEGLCTTAIGKSLAKDLVKAIVNRNISSGSNVETVAEALRRRCGSFCSTEDVVTFKAQEYVKRGSEAGPESEVCREYLNESLRLFLQVAGSLSMEQLGWVVEHYVALQFYAGSIQLCLEKAKESDRGNRALTWIQENRPQGDKRQEAFESRRRCYELVHYVIRAIDQSRTETADVLDGHLTPSGKRREEAADQINTSEDEVFQTDLYDWYLSENRQDRLLEVESPYVTAYLKRRSEDDIAHADLFWRYYVQNGQYQDAAVIQLELAKSEFKLSLDQRIEYLGNAKTNASTTKPGIRRSIRNEVLRGISDLLDVANIQSDLLQRLKGDSRITADRRPAVIQELDGSILPLSVLFNTYCEAAHYFDLCILIYEAADHRVASDIKATWQNLLERVHAEAEVQDNGPEPYEMVAETIRSLGTKLGLSETMFPVGTLLPMLKRYAFNYQPNARPETWVLDVFIDLQVPFETIWAILENMFYNDEQPFQGRNRRFIGNDMVYIARLWLQDSIRGNGMLYGGEDSAYAVSQMLHLIMQNGLDEGRLEECQNLRMRIETMLR
ncbi:MAG: hypothetical protein LQ350_000900 [Teloschistes chrysophthalmus]|nr:MAG: hypothetical protein LQ350_000900 [Niorma chrysophthalma]